jgi:hypothetical protein
MEIARPAGLARLPDRYGPLFDDAAAVFSADNRVRAMWLHGAIARDHADAGSDLDVSIAVRDEDFDRFAGEWRDWLAAITPTVTARPLARGSFYALTPGCERFDVIAERASAVPGTGVRRRVVVFDRDELTQLIPPPDDPPPDPATIGFLIEETLRQAANFPTVIVRDDWLMGVVAVQQGPVCFSTSYSPSRTSRRRRPGRSNGALSSPATSARYWRACPWRHRVLNPSARRETRH